MTVYMPLFRLCSTSRTLTQLHAHLLVTDLHRDQLASTKLIESYARFGFLRSSSLVFHSFAKPDAFMWGVLIKSHVWYGFFKDAIALYHNMFHRLTLVSSFIFPSVLRACSGIGDLRTGKKVHGRIVKCGLELDPVVQTAVMNMYNEMTCLGDACKVFDEMPVRDIVSWSSIITSHVNYGRVIEGLELFSEMILQGIEPDSVIMLSIAEACGELGLILEGKSVHGYVMRRSIGNDALIYNSLLTMYGRNGDLSSAEKLFSMIVNKSTSSWTAMITCYNQCRCYKEALEVFIKMVQASDAEPNAITIMGVLCSCARLGWLKGGKTIHGFAVKKLVGSEYDLVGSALIDLYSNCGNIRDCHKIFDETKERKIVSWNMLISGYAHEGFFQEAVILFVQMLKQAIMPDSFTLSSVISACGNAGFSQLGCQMHSRVVKTGFSNEFVNNSLIDMYSKCGLVDIGYAVFKKIQERSIVTWNSMICGFSQNGYSAQAIILFDKMYSNQVEIDEVTFLSVIQACANLGYLEKGKWLHHKLIAYNVKKDIYIDTALTDMYAKCGALQTARRIFDNMAERNVVTWSVMIGGYGLHGQINTSILLMDKMLELGIKPNEITFMNLLSACSHSGYVEKGKFYFNSMQRDFGIEPNLEHIVCLVDLLSRAGELNEAYDIIKSTPFVGNDSSIWGALLNGCRIYKRLDIIKNIERDLVSRNMDDSGYYTLLSNVYAEEGDWEEFKGVRTMMKSVGLSKVHGYSSIEIDKRVYRFGANDKSHTKTDEIVGVLSKLQCFSQECEQMVDL